MQQLLSLVQLIVLLWLERKQRKFAATIEPHSDWLVSGCAGLGKGHIDTVVVNRSHRLHEEKSPVAATAGCSPCMA